ncbi:polysaccharide biosynthesis C-terminal domain-containing protein [Methylobacterium variabile]|uniref:polysaccharide biosynthesis C-terminal domain-containing protein n=1 Tax=Methylobacterium variabile TaxID=298794 RepID=UPI00069DED4E|nr:polysaccharide biosynthesis C-terminal domain-containing protein [Methylobacterium variabile]
MCRLAKRDRAYAATALGLAGAALLALAGRPLVGEPALLAAAAAAAAIGLGLFDYQAALARARFVGGLYLRLVLVKNGLALLLMVGTAWATADAAAVMLAGGLSQFLAALIVHRALSDPPAAHAAARRREALRLFMGYGLPVIAANVVYQLMPFANRSAVAAAAGFAEAGYFSLAADIGGRIFSTLGAALDLLLFQIAVLAAETHGHEAGEEQVARNGAVVLALILPSAAGFWVLAPALEAIAVPEAYRGHFVHYTLLLLPGLVALALMNFALNPIFQIRRRTLPLVAAGGVGALVNLVAALALANPFGPSGIAAAQSLGFLAAMLFLGQRALTGPDRLRLPWRDLAAVVLATTAMTAAILPLRGLSPWLALPACIGLGGLVYAALVWRFDIAGLRTTVVARLGRAAPAE